METNMTEGRPLLVILRFMFPIFLGNVFQQFYNMVDSIIVGKFVGENALAGVGSTGTIMFLVIGLAIGMTTGFSVLTSQKFGAGKLEETKRSVANGIILAAFVAIILMIFSLTFMDRILMLMNTPDSIYREAYDYIINICRGLAATIYYNLFSAYLRAVGNSKVPLYFLIFSACLNIVLDLLFIISFGWGVSGAAWATVTAQGVSAILCLVYIMTRAQVLRPHREHWRLNRDDTNRQLAIGLPMSLQYGITASGTMVMQGAINLYPEAIAAFTAANKIQSVLTQGLISIGQCLASYAGQNYGKRDIARIRQGAKDSLKFVLAYSLAAALLVIFCLPNMLHLFFDASADISSMLPYARTYIYECATCYIPLGMIFIYRNTMQGCGYGLEAMSMGIIELFTRAGVAALSVRLGSYALAVGCDPAAWLMGGIYGLVLYLYVMKKIEK